MVEDNDTKQLTQAIELTFQNKMIKSYKKQNLLKSVRPLPVLFESRS